MEEWKEYKLGEVVNILDSKRVPLSSKERSTRQGCYPYYGAQGIIDYIDDYLFDGTYLLIAEDGENLKSQKQNVAQLASGKYWVNNHAHILESNGESDIRYICYLLNTLDLSGYITGSAQPKLNQANLVKIAFKLPPFEIQKDIADCLSVFDNKIEVNRKINENLEQQAQALFKSWFVDFEPFKNGEFVESELGMIPKGWRVVELQDVLTIKRGGSPRPIQDYLSTSGYRWLKISDATACQSPYIYEIKEFIKESGLCKTIKLSRGSLVLSNSATPGIPKILGVDSCIHDGWLYFPQSQLSKYYLYMLFKEKRDFLLSQGNGSVFTNLKTDIVKAMKIAIPNEKIMSKFNTVLESLFILIENKTIESLRLAELRDTLLPKLMSGELKVGDVTL